MKKLVGFCMTGVLATFMTPLTMTAAPHMAPAEGGYVQDHWDVPPAEFDEMTRHGFHDGVEAARRDIAAGRSPNAERHPRFRNPPVPPPAFEDYRHGFRDGYRGVFQHGGPPPAGYR